MDLVDPILLYGYQNKMNNIIEYLVKLRPENEANRLMLFINENKNFNMFPNREQIWSSILILANMRFDEIVELTKFAKKDWRDVVIAAGLAVDDWESIVCKFHERYLSESGR